MKGLILNDFLSMRKLLKSILFVFFAFAAIWGFMDQPETGAIIICVMGISTCLTSLPTMNIITGTSTGVFCR